MNCSPSGSALGFLKSVQVYMHMRRPRISVEPGDVPPAAAARRMGLSESDFLFALPALAARGFPAPDSTTGNFDLTAIDEWRAARHRSPNSEFTARDAGTVVFERIDAILGRGRH